MKIIQKIQRARTCEFVAVNRFPSSSVVVCEVASLEHELREKKYVSLTDETVAQNTHVRNYTVELAPCVSETMLARREFTEVASCSRDCIVEELEYNAS